jgi:hypothetical protein
MTAFSGTETNRDWKPGNSKIRAALAGPTAYESGGSVIDVAALADPTVAYAYSGVVTVPDTTYEFLFIPTASTAAAATAKIMAIVRSTGAEVAGDVDLQAITLEMEIRVGV